MLAILMMSANFATLDLLKAKVFWTGIYDIIICVHDVTNKILSRDSNDIVDVALWPKFGNFYETSYHNFNFIRIWPNQYILRMLLVEAQYLGLVLGMVLKFLYECGKRVKIRKFWGLILRFVEVIGKKLVVGPPPYPE